MLGPEYINTDGHGGVITAALGRRYPHPDNPSGYVVFFWHDQKFVGYDHLTEAVYSHDLRSVKTSPATAGEFTVTYRHTTTITYRWNGRRMVALEKPPTADFTTRTFHHAGG